MRKDGPLHVNLVRQCARGFPKHGAAWLAIGLLAILNLYFRLFLYPATPIWRGGDQAIHLMNALRMVEGQVIYRDFFQFILPGTELVYFVLFRWLGLHAWIPHAMMLFLGFALVLLTFAISKHLFTGWVALVPPLLFLSFGLTTGLDATHHWYSALLITAACAVLMECRSLVRLVIAGALCGLATTFTQSVGALAMVAIGLSLVLESRAWSQARVVWVRKEVVLIASYATALLAVIAWFVWQAGIGRFLTFTVRFPLLYYSSSPLADSLKTYMIGLPPVVAWPRLLEYLFIHALVPWVYMVFFMIRRREVQRTGEETPTRLLLLGLVGLFTFLGVASAPSYFRLCSVSPPALVLVTWLLNGQRPWGRLLAASLAVLALVTALLTPWRVQRAGARMLQLASGPIAFLDPAYFEKFEWFSHRTRAGEYVFQADFPQLNFPLLTPNPTRVPYLRNNNFTRPEQVREVLDDLQQHPVRYVMWSVRLDIPETEDTAGDHLDRKSVV